MYGEAVDDEKLRLLAFEDRWHFVAILCCKAQGIIDEAGPLLNRKVAVKLGLDLQTLDEVLRRLAEVGLIDRDTLQPTAWDHRQYKSDSSKERTREYRERKKLETERHRDVTVTLQETDTDTDTDTKTDLKSRARKRSTRLTADWVLPTTWMLWAQKERPDLDVEAVSDQFRDYWVGTGKAMADWEATWRNWVRREKSTAALAPRKTQHQLNQEGIARSLGLIPKTAERNITGEVIHANGSAKRLG